MLEPSAGFPWARIRPKAGAHKKIERGRDHEKEDGMFTGLDGAAECADHSTLRVTSTISEIPVYELMVCVKEGNYMGVITLASYLEDTTEEMAALFTALPQ